MMKFSLKSDNFRSGLDQLCRAEALGYNGRKALIIKPLFARLPKRD